MPFAMLIPDWNSLDSVRRAHSDLEAAALVFFALLVLFDVQAHLSKGETRKALLEKIGLCFFAVAVLAEIIAYPYGQRNDALSGQMIVSLDAKAQQATNNASKALTDSRGAIGAAALAKNKADAAGLKADTVSKKADQLDSGLRETQYAFSMRDLMDRDQVIEQLKQFKGKTVFVRSQRYMSDVDGYRVCKMVIDLARSAGMTPVDECATQVPSGPATGIQVCGPHDDEMLSFSKALARIDMGSTCAFGNVPHSPDLVVSVGSKALMGVGETSQTRGAEKRAAAMKRNRNPNAKP
jgi:hypothetical protein